MLGVKYVKPSYINIVISDRAACISDIFTMGYLAGQKA